MSSPALPIPDLGALGKSVKDFIDYWRNFKGKRIRIIGAGSSSIKYDHDITFHAFKEIIEGKVESVQAYPPGIILKEVEQFVRHEYDSAIYSMDKADPELWFGNGADSTRKEKIQMKFVSFNFINAIEFMES